MSVPIGKSLNQLVSPVSGIWLVLVVAGLRTEDTVPEPEAVHRLGGALRELTKEVVGIHVLLTRSLFGDGIPRNLPPTKIGSD
jgi:hypothetical protein